MQLEEIQKIFPDLQELLATLKEKLDDQGMTSNTRVFSVSTKIQTTRGDKKATWIVILDSFGNVQVTRT